MNTDQAERLLELASRRADQAQVSISRAQGSNVSYENSKLKTASFYQTSSASLSVIVNGKLGVASRRGPFDEQELVDEALATAEFGSDAPFEWPGPAPAPEVKLADPRIQEITQAQMVEWGGRMLDAIRSYCDEIVADAGAGASWGESLRLNSAGLRAHMEGGRISIGAGGMLTRGEDMLMAHHSEAWRAAELDPDAIARKAVEKFRLAHKNVPVESKVQPVIFAPCAADVLLMALALGVNGKNVLKGDSPLKDKLGERIMDERITIVDHPLIDYAIASEPYDGEGVAHRVTPLVENGVLKQFVYDLKTAALAGAASTGHGPGCHLTNLVIEAGDQPYEEMIAETEEGVLVDSVMGLGQGNAISGEFSVNLLLAYKIEHGEIVGRVKDAMLAGNAYDALNDVAALSREREWVYGTTLAPAIKINGLSVVAK